MAIVLALTALVVAADPQAGFAGRTLAEALQLLQQRGLPVVYSSAVVTEDIRVAAEPRAAAPRDVLDELLRPHALEAKRGPGGVLQVVRAPKPPPRRERAAPKAAAKASPDGAAPAPLSYDERVVVVAPVEDRAARGAVSESVLSGRDLRARTSVLANDVLTAMHASPRVAALSDFRSDFSVRGSGPRHVAVIIDGIAASHLRHAAYGIGESAALAMINPDAVDRATLQVGAHPRRFADALGGEVGITIREGSRTRTALSGSIGAVSASVVAEGPLGHAARGSWLLSARQSFLDWPTTSFAAEYSGTGFGFRDLQAKSVYDLSDTERVSMTVVAGQSLADNGGDVSAAGGFFQGRHDAALVTAGWRSAFANNIVLQQRAHIVTHHAHNTDAGGATLIEMRDRSIGYRADLIRVWPSVAVEAGAQVERADAGFERATYVNSSWRVSRGFTVSPGVRVSASPSGAAASPWLSAEWKTSAWTLAAAAGAGHQFTSRYAPERATYVDVSLERTVASNVRVDVTAFSRAEDDVIDPLSGRQSLSGRARGVELALDLAPTRGFSGSAGYTYGRTRYNDFRTGGQFWGDFDRRHAVNAFLSYALARTTIAAAFRSGTSFPIAGYFATRAGSLFAGDRRNIVRRPGYRRFDVQANQTLRLAGREVTLVGELLNVLNRTNYGPANGVIHAGGEAVGFSEKLLPRFASVGLRIAF